MNLEFTFDALIWLWQGKGTWTFLSLPQKYAAQIHQAPKASKPGGTVKVTAIIGHTTWKTSLFRDETRNTYLLPVKAAVRQKEQLRDGDTVEVTVIVEQAPAEPPIRVPEKAHKQRKSLKRTDLK